jgi:hypothetical protein
MRQYISSGHQWVSKKLRTQLEGKPNNSMRLLLSLNILATAFFWSNSGQALLVSPGLAETQKNNASLVVEVLVTSLSASKDPTFSAVLRASAVVNTIVLSNLAPSATPAVGDQIQIAGLGGEVNGSGVMYSGLPRPYVNHRYRAYLEPRTDGAYDVAGFEKGLVDLNAPKHPKREWTRNRTDGVDGAGTGPFLYWDPSYFPLSYFISESTLANNSSFPAAIDSSFETWRNVQNAKIEYIGLGCTSTGLDNNSGINTVVMVDNNWQFDPGYIAITRNFYVADGSPLAGLILNSDILLNAEDHEFTTTNEMGKYDVQDIVTHEAGHFIGMGHEVEPDADPTATMYPTASPNETIKRVLKEHDLDALYAAYGGVGIKDGFQHISCELPDGSSSCASVHRVSKVENVVGALLFILSLLAIPKFAKVFTKT